MPSWHNKIATPSRITCCMPHTTPRVIQGGNFSHCNFPRGAPSIGTNNVAALHLAFIDVWILYYRVLYHFYLHANQCHFTWKRYTPAAARNMPTCKGNRCEARSCWSRICSRNFRRRWCNTMSNATWNGIRQFLQLVKHTLIKKGDRYLHKRWQRCYNNVGSRYSSWINRMAQCAGAFDQGSFNCHICSIHQLSFSKLKVQPSF